VIRSLGESYDLAGNVLTSTDGDGNTTSNTYDGDRLISTLVKDAGNRVVSSAAESYDLAGNVLTSTDGDGNITSNTYDGNPTGQQHLQGCRQPRHQFGG